MNTGGPTEGTIPEQSANLPERTALQSLKPIEVGKSQAESFGSFAARLARRNYMSPFQLYAEPVNEAKIKRQVQSPVCRRIHRLPHRLTNLMTSPTGHLLSRDLAELADQPEILNLNWCAPDGKVSSYALASEWLKWCPLCLQERSYIRAVWELEQSTACAEHKTKLLTFCTNPECLKPIPHYRGDWENNACPHCHKPMEDLNPDFMVDAEPDEITVAKELGAFIAAATGGGIPWNAVDPVKSLTTVAAASGVTSHRGQAKFLGQKANVVADWEKGNRTVVMAQVFYSAFHIGVKPLDALMGGPCAVDQIARIETFRPSRRKWGRMSPDELKMRATALIGSAPEVKPQWITDVCSELRVSVRRFYDECPELAESLRRAQAKQREQARNIGWAEYDLSVKSAIRLTIDAAEELTVRSLTSRMLRPCLVRCPKYREHFHDLLEKARAGDFTFLAATAPSN